MFNSKLPLQEEELFEHRLRKSQAEAQLNRTMQSLKEIFGDDFPQSKSTKKSNIEPEQITGNREEELLKTIELLKRSLKRKTSATITLTKYKQVEKF